MLRSFIAKEILQCETPSKSIVLHKYQVLLCERCRAEIAAMMFRAEVACLVEKSGSGPWTAALFHSEVLCRQGLCWNDTFHQQAPGNAKRACNTCAWWHDRHDACWWHDSSHEHDRGCYSCVQVAHNFPHLPLSLTITFRCPFPLLFLRASRSVPLP